MIEAREGPPALQLPGAGICHNPAELRSRSLHSARPVARGREPGQAVQAPGLTQDEISGVVSSCLVCANCCQNLTLVLEPGEEGINCPLSPVTNHHQLSGPGQRPGPVGCSGRRVGWLLTALTGRRCCRAGVSSGGLEGRFASRLLPTGGYIQFLEAVGLTSLFCWWLLAGNCFGR